MAELLEQVPQLLLRAEPGKLELRDPQWFEGTNRRKALLLYGLARVAGWEVAAPVSEASLREGLADYFENIDRMQVKRWGKTDLRALHVLFESLAGAHEQARRAARPLAELQSADGQFAANPISTGLSCLALSAALPDAPALARAVGQLVRCQHADGSWRFFTTDTWDTSLFVRTLGPHPHFRARCLPAALDFLRGAQNADGGWGFDAAVESDSDSTACVAMCFRDRGGADQERVRSALRYLAATQRPDGLWRTWQSSEDVPARDVLAHVIEALTVFASEHECETARAEEWLLDVLARDDEASTRRWCASWYYSVPYGVLEMSRVLDPEHRLRHDGLGALAQLQREDGGFAGVAGAPSSPLDTGLAVAASLAGRAELGVSAARALEYLCSSQRADGSWLGRPCMVGPRPLLLEAPNNTHAFAAHGLIEAARCLELY